MKSTCAVLALTLVCGFTVLAQPTNPVDRRVEKPITNTAYVNPLQERPETGDRLEVTCDRETVSGSKEAQVSVCEGNVDARIGTYRLRANKVTIYARNMLIADGNVIFDQAGGLRITGSHAKWNYKTGFFENSAGSESSSMGPQRPRSGRKTQLKTGRVLVNRSAPGTTVVPILIYENVTTAIDWLSATLASRNDYGPLSPEATSSTMRNYQLVTALSYWGGKGMSFGCRV
jgi:hypothetical protein